MNRYLVLLILFLPILVFATPKDTGIEAGYTSELDLLLRMAHESFPEELDKAQDYAVRTLELARQSDVPDREVASLIVLAEISLEKGDYIGSFRNYQNSVEIAEDNLLDACIIDSYLGLAKFYIQIGEMEEANNYLIKALDKSILIDDNYRMGLVQAELSYSHRQKKEFDLSNSYAEEAIKVFKTEKDDYNLAISYIRLAKNYLDLGDFDKAYEIDNWVLELTENNSDHRNRGLAYNDLAWNYFQRGDMKKALEFNMKALSTRIEFGYKVLEVSSLINIAVLFIEWERYEDAYDFFDRARKEFEGKNTYAMEELKVRYYEKISELDELAGNIAGALENHKKFHRLDNEFKKIRDNNALNRIKTQFEIERYSKAKSDLNKLQQIEIKRQRIALIAILIIAVLTLASIFFLYSRYRLKKKLNDELSKTNLMLQKVNEKTSLEIAEKKRMETIINANADHLKLINRILRHDITNDLVTIKSGIKVYDANGDKEILDEINRRVDKSVKLIQSMREFEKFMNVHTQP